MVKQQPENEIGKKARAMLMENGFSRESMKEMGFWFRDALRSEYAPNEDRHLTDAVFDFAMRQTMLVPKAEEEMETIYREFFYSYGRVASRD